MNISDDSTPALLTTKQVAELLCISSHTLEVARCEGGKFGEIRYIKMGRSIRYRLTDVEGFIASHVVSPATSANVGLSS